MAILGAVTIAVINDHGNWDRFYSSRFVLASSIGPIPSASTPAPAEPDLLTLREIYERYGTEGRPVYVQNDELGYTTFYSVVFSYDGEEHWVTEEHGNILSYRTNHYPKLQLKVLDYFELDNASIGACTCSTRDLMCQGCTCGSIQRYGSTG